MASRLSKHHLLEVYFLFILIPFSKPKFLYVSKFILGFSLDDYIFVVSFTVRKLESSNLILSAVYLALLNLLHLDMNFRISLLIYTKRKHHRAATMLESKLIVPFELVPVISGLLY